MHPTSQRRLELLITFSRHKLVCNNLLAEFDLLSMKRLKELNAVLLSHGEKLK